VGHTFAIEHAPADRRGLIGGFIQSGFPAGDVLATHVFDIITAELGREDMWLSPAVILTIGAVMTFSSLLFSPETRGIDLAEAGGIRRRKK